MKNITFNKILEEAVSWFNSLSESTQKQLKQGLEHVAADFVLMSAFLDGNIAMFKVKSA